MFDLGEGLVGLLPPLEMLVSLPGHHASCKLLDVFYTGQLFHSGDGRDFLRVCLDPSSANDVAQKDTGLDTEYTLGGNQFPSVFFEGFERLLKVGDEVVGGL